MKAAFVRELGGADRIEIGPLPVPVPGPTDVLVHMEASAADAHRALEAGGISGRIVVLP